MKKNILLISLISLLFISCENAFSKIENPSLAENSTNTPAVTTRPSEDGKTYITFGDISFENESRTINPVYNRDDLTALYIKGMETTKVTPTTKPNDYTTLFGLYNPKATSYEDLCTKTFEITPGVWNFILYATLYDFEFSGMTTVEVKPGITHSLNFTLTTTNTSSYPYGIIDITVDFTGNADRVVATLKEKSTSTTARISKTYTPTDTKNPISTVEGETYKRINFKTANTSSSSSGGVTSGKYYLLFEFFQDGFDEPINTVENIVRVENNFTTKKTLNLDLDELYTITYSYWKGTAGFDTTELESLSFDPATTVLPSVYSRKSETFTLPTPSLPGYTFDAWYKDTDFTEENKITQITQGSTGNLELYANFVAQGGGGNSFFVDPDANNDEESGLDASHPLKTIMAAIGKMNDSNTDYVINVMGDLFQANFSTEYNLEITNAVNGKARSITLRGNADSGTYSLDGQSGGDPTTVMKVTTSVPIILEGITVTGGCADSSCLGGAIYIGEESTVILGQGTIVNGGGDHGCGSAIYVAASDNGGVTKAGSLIMKDNAVVNADDYGEVYLCTGATIKVASALTGQSSVWDSDSGEYIPSSIVAKITPQVYAENTPVIELADDAPATLNISDVYEKFAVFEDDTTSWLITNEGKLAKASNGGNGGSSSNNDFVTVTGGTFSTDNHVGTIENDNDYNAGTLTIPNLEVCSHMVTQYEYEQLMTYYGVAQSNSALIPTETSEEDKKNTPAYFVTWLDAIVYCNLLSESKGLTPVYSLSGNNEITEADSPWTDWGHIAVDGNGKYYYNQTDLENHEETSSYDTDGGSFSYDLSANGYRLPTTAEYQNIMSKNLNLISGGYDEWCQNYNYSGYRHCYFDGTNKIPKQDDEIYSDYRANNMGFRVVRNSDFVLTGSFTFSGGETLCAGDENRESKVFIEGNELSIGSLWVCNHEVTQGEYEQYCCYTGAPSSDDFGKGSDYPVYYVSWYDAIVYCNLRSEAEGLTPCYSLNGINDAKTWTGIKTVTEGGKTKYSCSYTESISAWDEITCDWNADGYRLPTSAEWEYAARGANLNSTEQTIYSGTDGTNSDLDNYAWHAGNSGEKTHTVKGKLPNALNLYDMTGNVSEMCWDWHPEDNTLRSVRSSGFSETHKLNAIGSVLPFGRYNYIGFRVVRNAGANGGSNP